MPSPGSTSWARMAWRAGAVMMAGLVLLALVMFLGPPSTMPAAGMLRKEGGGDAAAADTSLAWSSSSVPYETLEVVVPTKPQAVRELSPRSGLPHVLHKLHRAQGPVRVAFLGGSVTSKPDCWRPQVMDLFRLRYPSVNWTEINASLGGTGSLFGAFRVDRNVIAHKPDLLFIEYAANDAVATYDPLPTAEGVIRKVRRALPQCDIVMVHITTEMLTDEYDLGKGRIPRVMQIYEQLAGHYDIPSIHLGLGIVERAKAGEVAWRSEEGVDTGGKFNFGSDGIHPHKATGCAAYVKAIDRSLPELERHAHVPREPLPECIHPGNFEAARYVLPDQAAMSAGVQKISPQTAKGKPYERVTGYLARRPGDTFLLPFEGSFVGLAMMVGPFSGDLVASIGDEPSREVTIFDTFCYRPNGRMGFYILYDDLEKGNHNLLLDVSTKLPAKQAIMATKQRHVPAEFLNDTDAVIIGFGFV